MKAVDAISKKIFTLKPLCNQVYAWKMKGKTVAFTNGCFDILHEGHIFSLSQAALAADYLIVGLNSDASTRELKGPERPINQELFPLLPKENELPNKSKTTRLILF